VNTTVEWNILKKDKEEWGIAALLAEARVIDGYCFYSYGPMFRKRLHNPAIYAKINLSLQNKFDSKHTLALYELFIDYFIAKKGYGETPWISIEDFRKLLGLKEDEYKQFRDLNYYIIQKSLSEINQKSDLSVKVEFQRRTRKIVAIKFRLEKNPNTLIDFEPIFKELPISEPESEITDQELYQALTSYGISRFKVLELLKLHNEAYIVDVLKYVDKQIKTGKIKDIPAFTVKALENDFRASEKTKFDLEKEQAEKQRLAAFKAQEDAEAKQRAQIEQEKIIEEAIKKLPESERSALQKEAERIISEKSGELSQGANKFLKLARQAQIDVEIQYLYKLKYLKT